MYSESPWARIRAGLKKEKDSAKCSGNIDGSLQPRLPAATVRGSLVGLRMLRVLMNIVELLAIWYRGLFHFQELFLDT